MDLPTLLAKECTSCTQKTPPLSGEQARSYLSLLSKWQVNNHKLEREIKTKDFEQALLLANDIGKIAQAQNHHPDLNISWGKLTITVFTHAINGLSENDFILAAKLDNLFKQKFGT